MSHFITITVQNELRRKYDGFNIRTLLTHYAKLKEFENVTAARI